MPKKKLLSEQIDDLSKGMMGALDDFEEKFKQERLLKTHGEAPSPEALDEVIAILKEVLTNTYQVSPTYQDEGVVFARDGRVLHATVQLTDITNHLHLWR